MAVHSASIASVDATREHRGAHQMAPAVSTA